MSFSEVPSNSITSIVGSLVGGNGNGFSGDNDVVNESKTNIFYEC